MKVARFGLLGFFFLFVLGLVPTAVFSQTRRIPSNISHVWANDGGDKVWRGDLRATNGSASVVNSIWDGNKISVFGAQNEVVNFNLILEAPMATANGVNVQFDSLSGPGGYVINGRSPTSPADYFNYVGRNIELFYIRYLKIEGMSILTWDRYDERHTPEECQRPFDSNGNGSGLWTDRPCSGQFYPDIAVPLELDAPFSIAAGTNQSIWADIYIPKDAPPGRYVGVVTILENDVTSRQIPVELEVRNFTLPDRPTNETMLYIDPYNIHQRFFGNEPFPPVGSPTYNQVMAITDTYFQMAHRHKISLIDPYTAVGQMSNLWTKRLDGSLFTPANGYDGPGVGIGNNVYSLGTYSSWWGFWDRNSRDAMWQNLNAYADWVETNGFDDGQTEFFIYLLDECGGNYGPTCYNQLETWSAWINSNPDNGMYIKSMATVFAPEAVANIPSLDIPTSTSGLGITEVWQTAVNQLKADSNKRFYMYNGHRPTIGSFAIEDDGVALRTLGWAQFKKGIDRWFYWEGSYYLNFQAYDMTDPRALTNVFTTAQTFGRYERDDNVLGKTGWNYTNGDGVLFYPGTERIYPSESYEIPGPIASLRLKHWRRGLQDGDYLALATAVNPDATNAIINRVIPQVLWEYGVDDPEDPTFVRTPISWSTNPDDWEAARAELADLIEGDGEKPFKVSLPLVRR